MNKTLFNKGFKKKISNASNKSVLVKCQTILLKENIMKRIYKKRFLFS